MILQPSSSKALCQLGYGQLVQYDATSAAEWLADAEASFRSSIEMEGKPITSSSIPDKLKDERWWKERHTKLSVPAANLGSSAGKMNVRGPLANTKQGPVSTKQGSAAHGGKGPPSKTASKPGAASIDRRDPSTNSSTLGAARKSLGDANLRSKVPLRGTATLKSGARVEGKTTAPIGGLKKGGISEAKKQTLSQKVTTITTTSTSTTTTTANKRCSCIPIAINSAAAEDKKKEVSLPDKDDKVELNIYTHHARLGLARTLIKTDDEKKQEEVEDLYEKVIKIAPQVHDAYIELGDMLAKVNPARAVGIYAKFPFNEPPTFDDAFLHGEIVRLLMKSEDYENPQLSKSMIAMGKALGIGVINKNVEILEGKFKYAVLRSTYAGIHGKPLDDEQLQAFFKFKCWL